MIEMGLRFKPAIPLIVSWGVALVLSTFLHHASAQSGPGEHAQTIRVELTASKPPASKSHKGWQQLSPNQKQALAPLGAQWIALTAQQQRKWLAISENFTQLSVADQITMHARMTDWVSLSPQQRNVARLNYNRLQTVSPEDKKAKWEAYQALSDKERQWLSSQSKSPAKSAAPSAKLPPSHQANTSSVEPNPLKKSPSIQIDKKTLLPRLAKPSHPPAPGLRPASPSEATTHSETAPT